MRHLLIVLSLFLSVYSVAQEQTNEIPIAIGYYTPYFIQPGGRISTAFELKAWETAKVPVQLNQLLN